MKIATEHCSSISKAMAREEFSVKMYTNSVKQNIKPSIGVSTALPTHPYSNKIAARDQLTTSPVVQSLKSNSAKVLPAIAALSVSYPAMAAADAPEMSAAYLPAILVPVVGIIFPALSMALFFLFTQYDDLEQIN